MKIIQTLKTVFAALIVALGCSWATAQDIKVVYHINTGVETTAAILGNVRNHLNADPTAKIVGSRMALALTFCWMAQKTARDVSSAALSAT